MIDKDFCSSSYLAFRYIEAEDREFKKGLSHVLIRPNNPQEQVLVSSASDIDREITKAIHLKKVQYKKLGLMLSGGMDSAILASYLKGCDAYTFRFQNDYMKEELCRAEYYADCYQMNLHYVDIKWEIMERNTPKLMKNKGAPVHSIEPQLLEGANVALADGVGCLIVGESSDLVFGGMDQLLAKDWTYEEFKHRYLFLNPESVLRRPVDMNYLFEKYRLSNNKIDFLRFMDEVFSIESSSSYLNAFQTAGIAYFDPYANLKMKYPLDLDRVRHGEPKYLIRELFAEKYPLMEIPNKVPMPRPVDEYFKNWKGPKREEFLPDLDMSKFSGNQKWQMFCLEWFLNLLDENFI